MSKVSSSLNQNTYLTDSSSMKQGSNYKGKTVCIPKIIDEEVIATVFLSVTTSIAAEIINDLKTNQPSVKNKMFWEI